MPYTPIINTIKEDSHGQTDVVKFGKRYFRTEDFEDHFSALKEISEKEYNRLLKRALK